MKKMDLRSLTNASMQLLSCIDDDRIFSIPTFIARKENSILYMEQKVGVKLIFFKDWRKVGLFASLYNKFKN